LDRLEERLEGEAARALDAAASASEQLAQAAGDPHLDHAQEALGQALETLRKHGLDERAKSSELDAQPPQPLTELPQGVQLDSAQLAKLAREVDARLIERLSKLDAARLIDARRLSELIDARLAREGEFDPDHVCDESCKKPGGT
jgi:hypothetical protein